MSGKHRRNNPLLTTDVVAAEKTFPTEIESKLSSTVVDHPIPCMDFGPSTDSHIFKGQLMFDADVAVLDVLPQDDAESTSVLASLDRESISRLASPLSIHCHRNGTLWIAWIESMSNVVGGGAHPSEAIANLLEMFDEQTMCDSQIEYC